MRESVRAASTVVELSPDTVLQRIETGAANAWEERNWIRSDLLTLAGKRRVDLRDPKRAAKAAGDLDKFFSQAEVLINHAREHDRVEPNDRLVRTLHAMAGIMEAEGQVEFRGDAHAERFAAELRQRYGESVVAELASGRTDLMAGDIREPDRRKLIARAIVSAAKAHVAFGLSLREATEVERIWDNQQTCEGYSEADHEREM